MERIFNKVKIKVDFNKSTNRVALSSGDELPTLMGKIKKYFEDLKTVAFSGKFEDLTKTASDTATQSSLGLTKLYSWEYCDENPSNAYRTTDGALTVAAALSMITSVESDIESLKSNSGASGSGGSTTDSRLDELFAKTTIDKNQVWTFKGDLLPTTSGKQSIGSSLMKILIGYFRELQADVIRVGNEISSEKYTGYYMYLGKDNDNTYNYCNGIAAFASGKDWGLAVGEGLYGNDKSDRTIANQVVFGHYNSALPAGTGGTDGTAFIIGNGTGTGANDGNAFYVRYDGSAYSRRTLLTGADYAEYMEWKDKNSEKEDRVGRFVTLVEDKIAIANNGDYIVGIVSGNPSVIGNDDFNEWSGRWLKDKFGRVILGDVKTIDNDTGEIKILQNQPQNNPDYDVFLTYIPRDIRPEWCTVGMLGVLKVIDDGSCVANGWCKVSADGIATSANVEENSFLTPVFKVMKRTADDVIEIFFK